MRPIRLLILLLAVSLALVLALMRPLQGRAMRLAKKAKAHSGRAVTTPPGDAQVSEDCAPRNNPQLWRYP